METIGFVGLGQMGPAMASDLQKAGYALRLYNRTADEARPPSIYGWADFRFACICALIFFCA